MKISQKNSVKSLPHFFLREQNIKLREIETTIDLIIGCVIERNKTCCECCRENFWLSTDF